MARAALHTLGCKVNQYETQKIAEEFLSKGFEVVEFTAEADVYIINSCTVTQTADSKSRQAARAAWHRNPHAEVILTGCYAETSPEKAAEVEGVTMIVSNQDKADLVDRVLQRLPESLIGELHTESIKSTRNTRTRALLKIQDGCNQFCAYCAVPYARSVMSSKPINDVISEANELAQKGFKEIVLTGIRLGCYNCEEKNLSDFLADLSLITGIERIRLSSIELTDIPDNLLDLMASNPKICNHLHIPLQSGDDVVLERMNRPYNISDFEIFVRQARKLIPDIAITTDIMVGFPGETDEEFENTYRFAERIKFARSHIFRYSQRPGTKAAEMIDSVSSRDKDGRSARLIAFTSECSNEFAKRLIEKTVPVLVEKKENCGKRSGLTDNYVRVLFDADYTLTGQIVDVTVQSVTNGIAMGMVEKH